MSNKTTAVFIFLLFVLFACEDQFLTKVDSGTSVSGDSFSDAFGNSDVENLHFCDWSEPFEDKSGYMHVDFRWVGDRVVERDFLTDEIVSEQEFSWSVVQYPPREFAFGIFCRNIDAIGVDNFWQDFERITFDNQTEICGSLDVPSSVVSFDYCYIFNSLFCTTKGGSGCWHAVEMIGQESGPPNIQVSGTVEYCVNGGVLREADIDDKRFYMNENEAKGYEGGFYLDLNF